MDNKVWVTKFIDGVEWKVEIDYTPKKETFIKGDCIKKLSKSKLKKLTKQKPNKNKGFYKSNEWLRLRYRVLLANNAECMCCGSSYKKNKAQIHVDHIKPRSKYPELELQFENLQILCSNCNLGKSNIDRTDWR